MDNAASIQKRYQSRHVHPDYLKLFMDGCVEMGTGFMLERYSTSPADSIFSGFGTALWSREAMDSLVWLANRKGLSVHTHTMGDGAVRRSVEAYRDRGKYADFVIVDEDVLTVAPQALSEVKVLNTFFEGQEVYGN